MSSTLLLQVPSVRPTPQVDSKIKDLQSTLRQKVQTFEGKRLDPRDDCGHQTEIKKLVKQFDPLDESNKLEKNGEDLLSHTSAPLRPHTRNTIHHARTSSIAP